MRFLLLLIIPASYGAITSVCATGCDKTSLQTAWDEAANGDTLTLKAGETYTGNYYFLDKQNITITTDQAHRLPPPGTRLCPTGADSAPDCTGITPFLPKFTPTTMTSSTIYISPFALNIQQNGVDTANDTITITSGFPSVMMPSEGTEVTCFASFAVKGGTLPAPLNVDTKYYVKNWNSGTRTGQLSLTPGGDAINLTTVGSADSADYYTRPSCTPSARSPKGLVLRGLWIYDGGNGVALVTIGGSALNAYNAGPSVTIRQCLIEGDPANFTRPYHGVFIQDGQNHAVLDSVIRNISGNYNNVEAKALLLLNVRNVHIENNYLSAVTSVLFAGGADSPNRLNVSDVKILRNVIIKPGRMHYRSGSGAPTGDCYYGGGSGAFYRDEDPVPNTCANNACYVCNSSGAWVLDTGATLRTGRIQNKNLLEFKTMVGALVEGNVFEGQSQTFDAGQGWTLGASTTSTDCIDGDGVTAWNRNHRIIFRNNYMYRNWTGLFMRSSPCATGLFPEIPQKENSYINNIQAGLTDWPELCESSAATPCSTGNGVKPASWLISSGQSLTLAHNTVRGTPKFSFDIDHTGAYTPTTFVPFMSKDNLFQVSDPASGSGMAAINVNGGISSCDASWIAYGDTKFDSDVHYIGAAGIGWGLDLTNPNCATYATNPVKSTTDPLFAGTPTATAPNSSLQATSVYSDQNASATHLASDGSSMGADEKQVTQHITPAINGTPNMRDLLSLRVTRSGTTLQFNFAARGASCTVSVYSAIARTTANQAAAPQTDTDGAFTFTSISANPAWYHVDCASSLGLHWVDTI